MTISDKLSFIARSIRPVYAAGKANEYNEFWDDFQQNGDRRTYIYGFAGRGWTALNFRPKYSIVATGNNNHMFNSNNANMDLATYLEGKGITLNLSGVTSASELFRYSMFTRLPRLDLTKATSMYVTFGNCTELHTIDEIVVTASHTFLNTFQNCTNLVEVKFSGVIGNSLDLHWSTKLSAESYYSIITTLSSSVSGQKFIVPPTAEATYNANPPQGEGVPQTWKALIGTKSNWTIAES